MKYKDEGKKDANEGEEEALRRLRKAGASAVQAEELMRLARTEVAAAAGAGYGRVSLEALYLLPTEFANAYQRLFLQALKESPGRTGEANPLAKRAPRLLRRGEPNQKVVVRDRDSGEVVGEGMAEVLDRDPDRGGGSARSSGRRHRDHWTIKDERAFRLKQTVDDQLRELADIISRAAGKPSRLNQADGSSDSGGNGATPTCSACRKFLKATWRFCPHCGEKMVKRESTVS